MQGAVVDVFTALSNAQGLRHLNLYHNYGLTGPLVPPLSGVRSGEPGLLDFQLPLYSEASHAYCFLWVLCQLKGFMTTAQVSVPW